MLKIKHLILDLFCLVFNQLVRFAYFVQNECLVLSEEWKQPLRFSVFMSNNNLQGGGEEFEIKWFEQSSDKGKLQLEIIVFPEKCEPILLFNIFPCNEVWPPWNWLIVQKNMIENKKCHKQVTSSSLCVFLSNECLS